MSAFTVRGASYLIGTNAVVITLDTPLGRKSFQTTQSALALANVRRTEQANGSPTDPNPDLSTVVWGDDDVLFAAKNWIGERFPGISDQVELHGVS